MVKSPRVRLISAALIAGFSTFEAIVQIIPNSTIAATKKCHGISLILSKAMEAVYIITKNNKKLNLNGNQLGLWKTCHA